MLKLVFVLVNFYDKLFITDRIIHINEPSLTKWTNERDNFRHDKHQNLHNQTFFYQLRKRKKNFTSTIFFLNYILNYNFFFFFFLFIFFDKYSNLQIDSQIIIFPVHFHFSLPPLIVLAKDLANPNIDITIL